MAIRLPLQTVLSYSNTAVQAGGPTSLAGGAAKPFQIPQDTDNVVVKFTASVLAGGVSATFQTTDDGGTTWYDVARTSIVSNATATTAEWLSIPVVGFGIRATQSAGSIVATGSVITNGAAFGAIGSAAASTLGVLGVSGLPILSQQNRIFLRYTNAITSVLNESVTVSVNNQSATS